MRNITLEILFRWFDVCDSFWSLGEKLWFRWTFLMMSCRLISRLSASPTDWRVVCRQAAAFLYVYFNESKYNKRESRKRHRETREKFPFLMFSRKTSLCWGGERRRDTTKHTAQKKRGEKKSYRDFLCLFAFEYRSIVVAVDGFAGLEIKFMHVCFSSLFSLLLLWYQTVSWYFSIYYTHITSKPKPEPAHLFLYGEWLLARALCI